MRIRQRRDYVPFTRANIYPRDGHRCQYCGVEFASEDLTFDHVVPSAQGGRKTWDNIVTACMPCNREKDARTPEQAGMTLKRATKKPASTPALRVTVGLRRTPESWRNYLYWNMERRTPDAGDGAGHDLARGRPASSPETFILT